MLQHAKHESGLQFLDLLIGAQTKKERMKCFIRSIEYWWSTGVNEPFYRITTNFPILRLNWFVSVSTE